MHGSSRRQHGSVEVVEVVAVRGFGACAVGSAIGIGSTKSSLELIASIGMGMVHKRSTLRHIAVLNVGGLALRFRVTESEASVIEALEEQDNISKGVVDGEDDLMVVSENRWPVVQVVIPLWA